MMEARRKSLSDMPELRALPNYLPSILERSPLLDRRELRSTWSPATPGISKAVGSKSSSVSVFQLQKPKVRSSTRQPPAAQQHLKTFPDQRPRYYNNSASIAAPPGLHRSRSAPFNRSTPQYYPLHRISSPQCPDHAQFRSSPQYRVNPVVKFDERLLIPERMNYGIAGYNTSRRPVRSSFSGKGVVIRTVVRPRRLQILRLWTRRLRVRLIRIRVRSACSRLMMRFRIRRRSGGS